MGPPVTERAGMDVQYPDATATILMFVAAKLRAVEEEEEEEKGQQKYTVQILPDEDKICKQSTTKCQKRERADKKDDEANKISSLKERELDHVKGYDFDNFVKVFNAQEELVATYTTESLDKPWLVIQCENQKVQKHICELLTEDFDLAVFPYQREVLPVPTQTIQNPELYQLEAVTGTASVESKCNPTTLFSLYYKCTTSNEPASTSKEGPSKSKKKKLVAKALCSYSNGEMNSVGPTLEILEVAPKWRRHGLGSALMRAIHTYMCSSRFHHFETNVLFSVCHVTNYYATRWFQRRHRFRDLDGLGEELGKHLYHDEYELLDDEEEDED